MGTTGDAIRYDREQRYRRASHIDAAHEATVEQATALAVIAAVLEKNEDVPARVASAAESVAASFARIADAIVLLASRPR